MFWRMQLIKKNGRILASGTFKFLICQTKKYIFSEILGQLEPNLARIMQGRFCTKTLFSSWSNNMTSTDILKFLCQIQEISRLKLLCQLETNFAVGMMYCRPSTKMYLIFL